MGDTGPLPLAEVERRVCDLTAEHLAIPRPQVTPASSLVEDLGCDSLDLVELIMRIAEAFAVTLPGDGPDPVYKAVFTRRPFRLSDLAELVYLRQGTGTPARSPGRESRPVPAPAAAIPFTQLSGVWDDRAAGGRRLFEPLEAAGAVRQYRRRSDGMRCVRVPRAAVEIGCDGPDAGADERPPHTAEVDAFLIDAEPVSATAYCRFLNSAGAVAPDVLADWFVLDPHDDRTEQAVVERAGEGWQPVPGADRLPMVLVSWYGANAYSLWANGREWRGYRDEAGGRDGSFLPTEVEWEYAARGARSRRYPWGDGPPDPEVMCYGRHRRGDTYRADTLPMAAVNARLGVSPLGPLHMAGTVWQWCRDWYDGRFYHTPEAAARNPVNRTPTGVRSERGGSWVGPAGLCRSSFRRGRPPAARGRCLGFRCVSRPDDAG